MSMLNEEHVLPVLEKVPTGIRGLDEITEGGLPKGRPALVCGDSGSGKTVLAMEFLVRGRSLEEKRAALTAQVAALQAVFEAEEEEVHKLRSQHNRQEGRLQADRASLGQLRGIDLVGGSGHALSTKQGGTV